MNDSPLSIMFSAWATLSERRWVTSGERRRDGTTQSTLASADGSLKAESAVTINSGAKRASFAAAIGHEGSQWYPTYVRAMNGVIASISPAEY